jgi:hypothetical protein
MSATARQLPAVESVARLTHGLRCRASPERSSISIAITVCIKETHQNMPPSTDLFVLRKPGSGTAQLCQCPVLVDPLLATSHPE